jgi:long-chain acyl-CoA synthetase
MAQPRRDTVVSAFERLVSRAPLAPLVSSPGHATVTVGELDALARAAVQALGGMPPGQLVGLAAPNGPGFLAAFLALRREGFPVLLLDSESPLVDRRRTASLLGAAALLSCAAWPRSAAAFELETLAAPAALTCPEGTAVLKLTSGSTGAPRGVAVSADALVADDEALAATMGLGADERIVAAVPFSHSYGFASVVLPALRRGSLLVVPEPDGPLGPLAAAQKAGATFFPTVPAYLQALLKMSKPPAWPATLRLVVSAGAPLLPETAARFRETYGRAVHAFYGASECGGICYDREGDAGERGTVGPPVEGVRVDVEATGDGLDGVVTVRSPALGSTYHPDPEPRLTAERFHTNDVGTWTNGELRLVRRLDGLINVKGKKVDPSEIERVVAALPGVDDVVALAVPGREMGSHLLRVVVACREQGIRYEDVLAHCRVHLPDHKVPRSILLVATLPRTPRGKVDRGALLAAEAGNPDG